MTDKEDKENTEAYCVRPEDIGVLKIQDPNNEDYVIIHAFPAAPFIAELSEGYRIVLHKESGLFTPAFAEELVVKSLLNRFYGNFSQKNKDLYDHVSLVTAEVVGNARARRKEKEK